MQRAPKKKTREKHCWRRAAQVFGAALLITTSLGAQHVIPSTAAHTLSGRAITLPAPNRLTLVVASPVWWAAANDLCARRAILDCYQTAVDSRTPGFQTASTARRQETGADWNRVAILSNHLEEWKTTLALDRTHVSSAVLLAPDGTILWQGVGRDGEALPPTLEAALDAQNF